MKTKKSRAEQVRRAITGALQLDRRSRRQYLECLAETLADAWDKDEKKMFAYLAKTYQDRVNALRDLEYDVDPSLGRRKFRSTDMTKIDSAGGFVRYVGKPDSMYSDRELEDRRVEKAQDRQVGPLWVVMSHYDDEQYGEFGTREEAEALAGAIQGSCEIRMYSREYGLEYMDLTYTPMTSARDNRLDPGKRPQRGNPRKGYASAKDADLWS